MNHMTAFKENSPLFDQAQALKKMPPAQKWAVASRLYRTAYDLKRAWIEKQHPDWPADRIQQEVRKIFLHART